MTLCIDAYEARVGVWYMCMCVYVCVCLVCKRRYLLPVSVEEVLQLVGNDNAISLLIVDVHLIGKKHNLHLDVYTKKQENGVNDTHHTGGSKILFVTPSLSGAYSKLMILSTLTVFPSRVYACGCRTAAAIAYWACLCCIYC